MKNSIQPNPFTPKSGIDPRVFVGRDKEIEIFKRKLDDAIKLRRFDHFLVLGEWGIGKTSLLREFKKIAQSNKVLASYLPIREFQQQDEFITATVNLISQIPKSIPIKYQTLKNFINSLGGIGINLPLVGGGVQLPDKNELKGDPQVILLDALINLWHSVKSETEVLVVLLDDVQNYQHISGYLTIIKNVLNDDTIIKETGFLFILASTPVAWAQFLKKHHPIGRYFTPIIKLGRLDLEETLKVLDQTLHSTGVVFDEAIKRRVYEYSEGHPYELQVLCSFLYDNQIAGKVSEDSWEVSLDMAITQLGDILLDHLYNEASPSEAEVLKALSEQSGPYESYAITGKMKRFSAGTVNKYLIRLVSKNLLLRKERGVYAFPDRMCREYVFRRL